MHDEKTEPHDDKHPPPDRLQEQEHDDCSDDVSEHRLQERWPDDELEILLEYVFLAFERIAIKEINHSEHLRRESVAFAHWADEI